MQTREKDSHRRRIDGLRRSLGKIQRVSSRPITTQDLQISRMTGMK